MYVIRGPQVAPGLGHTNDFWEHRPEAGKQLLSTARPKVAKLAANGALRRYVQDRLSGRLENEDGAKVDGPSVPFTGRNASRRADRRRGRAWSPEQIAARLPIDYPDGPSMRISHEAIYQALYVESRGGLAREHVASLRTGRALRTPRARSCRERRNHRGFITSEVTIERRPAEVIDRAAPGHWEGDLIIGLNRPAIGTLVEPTTRYTILLPLPRMKEFDTQVRVKNGAPLAGHGAVAVKDAIIAMRSRTVEACATRRGGVTFSGPGARA